MPDQSHITTQGSTGGLVIPPAVQEKHPELIDLILKSESMNDGERQYWVDILPVMTPDQVEQLRNILQNERDQLAAIDAKYAQEIAAVAPQATLKEMAKERSEHIAQRGAKEQVVRSEESAAAEDILKKME